MNANTIFTGRCIVVASLLIGAAWLGAGCGEDKATPSRTRTPRSTGVRTAATTSRACRGRGRRPPGRDARGAQRDDMAGRLTGTAGGDLAEQYVVDFLTAAGFEPETQDVEFPLFEVESPAELAIVDGADAVIDPFVYFEEFREVDYSGSGSATGTLVFAGYGVVKDAYDSFAGMDLAGDVVAMLTGVPTGEV